MAAATVVVVAVALVWEPWTSDGVTRESVESEQTWLPLSLYLGEADPYPRRRPVQIRSDPTAFDSRRLVESAVSTYEKSTGFYDTAAETAAGLALREPEEGETVAVLVSDRHDNIGMDRVARAVGDRAGATVVLDAGDDSTGQPWEAFSLDSVSEAFDGYDRFAVPGNHDSGDFVADYLDGLGWTILDGAAIEGPGGGPLIGIADPRSSGLGNWRDESGLRFTEVGERFSEAVCDAEDRVATVLVHDVNLARLALAQGVPTWSSAAMWTSRSARPGSRGTTAKGPATPTRPARPAVRRTPSRSAASCAAMPWSPLITYRENGRPAGIQAVTPADQRQLRGGAVRRTRPRARTRPRNGGVGLTPPRQRRRPVGWRRPPRASRRARSRCNREPCRAG